VSGERTVPDRVEEIDAPVAAVDPPPRRPSLGRLPPLADPLAGLTAIDRTHADGAGENEPSGTAAPRAPTRLGRLPPFREATPRVSAPELEARTNDEATVAEMVEEIDLDPVPPPPPPPPRDRLGKPTPSGAPPPPPPAPSREATASHVPAPADTVREDAAGARDATRGEHEESAEPAPAPPLAMVERPSVATVVEDSLEYHCQTCDRRVPRAEIQVLTRDGRKTFAVCPVCNGYLGASRARGAARPDAAPPEARARRAERPRSEEGAPRSLQWVLVDAVAWPFAREVLPTLLGLTCVVWLLSSAWIFGQPAAELAGLALAFAVLTTRAAAVIHATHRGDDAPPPLFGDGAAGAIVRHVSALIVGGLPLLAALVSETLGVRSPTERTVLVVAGIAAFCLYVPAGQIVVASVETLGAALNPLRPISFALRVGRAYLVPCTTLLVIAIAHLVAVGVTRMVGVALFGGPTVGWGLLASLVVVGGVLVEARVLGLVVREHRFDLSLV
jgi:hypothetical protein